MAKRRAGSQIGNLTTKSGESIRFHCVQVVCNTSLKICRRGLQLCFRPDFNRRSAHKVMGPKVAGIPTLGISKLPFGSPGTKCRLDVGVMERHRVSYKGEGESGFPQVWAMVSLLSLSLLVARLNTKSAPTMH